MRKSILSLIIILFFVSGCKQDTYFPKPTGYLRISLPGKKYIPYDSLYPFIFDKPVYTVIEQREAQREGTYKFNLFFTDYGARVHLTYLKVGENLYKYIDDVHNYVHKHIPKATNINTREFTNPAENVHGLTYEISGPGVASPYQFYLTDSMKHFLRGALYFNTPPNNDSLAPVIDFIQEDVEHMISSLRWK